MKRLGVVGGLGTETSCAFCLNINNRLREITGQQPSIVMENVPLTLQIERSLINGETSLEMLQLLEQTIRQLDQSKVDIITIPCNTVHTFIEEMRAVTSTHIVSIIEECAKECKRRKVGSVGLLATKKSINERLHKKELEKAGINIIEPTPKEQFIINEVVFNILDDKSDDNDKEAIQRIITRLKSRGAQAIILGCTDLQNILTKEPEFIDTLAVLENAIVKKMMEKTKNE